MTTSNASWADSKSNVNFQIGIRIELETSILGKYEQYSNKIYNTNGKTNIQMENNYTKEKKIFKWNKLHEFYY